MYIMFRYHQNEKYGSNMEDILSMDVRPFKFLPKFVCGLYIFTYCEYLCFIYVC